MTGLNVVPYQARPYKHFCAGIASKSHDLLARSRVFAFGLLPTNSNPDVPWVIGTLLVGVALMVAAIVIPVLAP